MVTRADLAPGDQAVQGMHAALLYAVKYPQVIRYWHERDQVLVFLAVPGERWLELAAYRLRTARINCARFHEPDMDGQLTAIAAGPRAARKLSHLPLALRGEVRT